MADPASPLATAVARVGDRWTLLVIQALLDSPRRFGELRGAIPGIASNVLSQRLKHLVAEELVAADAYTQRPPRFTYALTPAGQQLAGALRLLAAWGAEHGDDTDAPHHVLCGTALQVRWFCPTCEVVVAEADTDDLRYA
ncbi:MAG: helix-turn-helix transcriptional regulator [Euzebyales bacterium]|nr:helix-turn-helix transcriptional regulator [Euzebyales bacterium]